MKLPRLFGRKSSRVADVRLPLADASVEAQTTLGDFPRMITYTAKPPTLTKKERHLLKREMRSAVASDRVPSVAESMYMKTPEQFAAKFRVPDVHDELKAVSVPARVNATTIGQLSIPLEGYNTATEKIVVGQAAKGRVLVDANSQLESEREYKLPPPAMAAHKEPAAVPVVIGKAYVPDSQIIGAAPAQATEQQIAGGNAILLPVQLTIAKD